MEQEMLLFKENVDAWIKHISSEYEKITDVSSVVEESVNNIQHNYELIHELKEEINELKQELNALKLIQLIYLREKLEAK